jgi:hypothetical protein
LTFTSGIVTWNGTTDTAGGIYTITGTYSGTNIKTTKASSQVFVSKSFIITQGAATNNLGTPYVNFLYKTNAHYIFFGYGIQANVSLAKGDVICTVPSTFQFYPKFVFLNYDGHQILGSYNNIIWNDEPLAAWKYIEFQVSYYT